MPNRLKDENSPYLIQHADNPVDWYPWNETALIKAQMEDKPIFLSIGYAACHWCHVMAHESFEDEEVAALLNKDFVSIKVDREERPDLDSIYMSAVTAMTGQGGWPLSVFLTPQGEPFYGGTYFPPTRRYNLPSFREILLTVSKLWREDRDKLLKSGKDIVEYIRSAQKINLGKDHHPSKNTVEKASLTLAQSYDWKNGGWGQAPKFPQPMALEFLLRRALQGDKLGLDVAIHALLSMAKGGMYDVVGGGFARYSTDNFWLVPHFEKMLYDNALLARVYLYAYLITKDWSFLEVCRNTLSFIEREMTDKSGGFYSSLDADSDGQEGKYYIWDYEELIKTLEQAKVNAPHHPELDRSQFFIAAYGLSESGNFEGKIILQRNLNDLELSERFDLPLEEVRSILRELHVILLEKRQRRVHPGIDDKVLVAWNALALQTFAEAARYLADPAYLRVAQSNAHFLINHMLNKNRLNRSWRGGKTQHNAFLEDYAALSLALLALYHTDQDQYWYEIAVRLIHIIVEIFSDQDGGFFDISLEHETLLVRPKDLQDNATPSGNSLTAMALLQIAALSGNAAWRNTAEMMLSSIGVVAERYPTAFSNWLCAYDFATSNIRELAILIPDDRTDITPFTQIIWESFRPNLVLASSKIPVRDGAPELLKQRAIIENKITAYLCENFFCREPVNSLDALKNLLYTDS